jgi:purine-binding chemotaxis protein CheW
LVQSTLSDAAQLGLALLVRLGPSLHGLPVAAIEEVLPNLPIEPAPHCPPHVKGVIFVRGHLIPVIDSRRRLGMDGDDRSPDPHIVCVRSGGKLIGLEVDEAIDLVDLRGAELLPADDLGGGAGLLVGLMERDGEVIRLLDTDAMATVAASV